MKKLVLGLLSVLLLTACGNPKSMETVTDVYYDQPQREPAAVILKLPEDAAAQVVAGEQGRIYLCEGYSISVQTLPGGDLERTLQSLTGHSREELEVIPLSQGEMKHYACAWASAGEGEDQVNRALILDDGAYHYAVTVMAPAGKAAALRMIWDQILASVTLNTDP